MPIISQIGRRTLKIRLLIFTIYGLLIAGAVTMVYPFGLMIAGSTKSAVDVATARLVPSFLVDDKALYRKHVEGLFNESLDAMRIAYDQDATAFQQLEPPARPNRALADAWITFLDQTDLPDTTYSIGYIQAQVSRGVIPHELRAFKRKLIERFDGDIDRLNQELATEFVGWNAFLVLPEDYLLRRNKPGRDQLSLAFRAFKTSQPIDRRYYFSVEGFYKVLFLKTQYTRDIAVYNREHGTNYRSYDQVRLDRRRPAGPGRTDQEGRDWEEFVRTILNLLWIRADPEARPPYQRFLRAKYRNVETLNRNYETRYTSFDEVPLVKEPPDEGLALSDWDAMGIALHELNRYTEAISAHKSAIAIKPDYAEAYFSMGYDYELSGHNAKAAAAYRQAISLDPNGDTGRIAAKFLRTLNR